MRERASEREGERAIDMGEGEKVIKKKHFIGINNVYAYIWLDIFLGA